MIKGIQRVHETRDGSYLEGFEWTLSNKLKAIFLQEVILWWQRSKQDLAFMSNSIFIARLLRCNNTMIEYEPEKFGGRMDSELGGT